MHKDTMGANRRQKGVLGIKSPLKRGAISPRGDGTFAVQSRDRGIPSSSGLVHGNLQSRNDAAENSGSAAPPAAVRHALAPATSAPDAPNGMCRWRVGAGRTVSIRFGAGRRVRVRLSSGAAFGADGFSGAGKLHNAQAPCALCPMEILSTGASCGSYQCFRGDFSMVSPVLKKTYEAGLSGFEKGLHA